MRWIIHCLTRVQVYPWGPVMPAILGWLFLQERMDSFGLAGAVLIVGSLVLSQRKKVPQPVQD